MVKERSPWKSDRLVAIALLAAITGCSSNSGDAVNVDTNKLAQMGGFYTAYLRVHKNKTPKDEQELRTFLSTKQAELEKAGLTVDTMFVSPRNGGPLDWVYGRKPPVGPGAMTYLGYERTPVDGKRFVIAGLGMYEEMDEARFRSVFPNVK